MINKQSSNFACQPHKKHRIIPLLLQHGGVFYRKIIRCLFCLSFFALTSCPQNPSSPNITSVEIKNYPFKMVYTVGESFSADGLVVTVHYSDGTNTDIAYSSAPDMFKFSDTDTSSSRYITVDVYYGVQDSVNMAGSFPLYVSVGIPSIEGFESGQMKKGRFSLEGRISGLGTIIDVFILFEPIINLNANPYKFKASVNVGKWNLDVDTENGTYDINGIRQSIPDGMYRLWIEEINSSSNILIPVSVLALDNTAPVIMVDTPDVKAASMNYDVQIEGKLYDQSEVQKLTVVISDTSGREVIRKDANVTNNSTWKVTFDGDTELGLAAGNQLLADNGNYYYYVVATDAVNNTSEYFFHKPDVYTQFTGRKLDISEWASFDKGDTNTVSGQTLNRDWFNSIKIHISSMRSPSSVSIAPYFSYSSQDIAGIEWENIADGSSLAKDTFIVGVITPPAGVDSPFKNETFKCYIFPGLGTNGTDPFVIDANGLVKIKRENTSGEIYEENPSSANQWPAANISITNTGSARNFNISTELPNTHSLYLAGEVYYIYIEIENASGTKFFASKRFDINPGTPTLTITTAELSNSLQMTTNGTGDFNITGKAFTSGGVGCAVVYKITKDGQETNGEVDYAADFNTSGEWTLPLGPLNLTDGTYSFTFTAEVSGLRAIESRTITIDRTAPDLSIVAISQNSSGNKVTVSGNANDANGLSSLKYRLTPLQDWQTEAVKYNWVYEIDTTDADEEEHTFEVEVVDAAGNSASASDTIVIDHNPPELSVTNGNWSSRDVQAMTGTASDTHFSSLSVTYRNSSVSSSTAVTENIDVDETTHAWSWTPAGTIADGIYDVTLEARDTANKTQTYTTSFTCDQNGPVIEEVSLSDGDVTELGGTYVLDITVKASDTPAGLKIVQYRLNNSAEWTTISNVSTHSTISLSGLPEGENTIEIKAIDNSNNETIYTYTPEGGTPQSVIHFTTDYNEPEV